MRVLSSFLIALFFPLSLQSATLIVWRCTAIDSTGTTWADTGNYPRNAEVKAKTLCKKQSTNPLSCYASREFCDVFSAGDSPVSFWRCTAMDLNSQNWQSGPYGNKLSAGNAALNLCKKWSKKPDTCYMYLFTCREKK